jgi:hypothetical protein
MKSTWICLTIFTSAIAYSISEKRQLIAEGSWFFLRILHLETTSFDQNHLRYLTALWEMPTLLLRQVTKDSSLDLTPTYMLVWQVSQFLPFFLGIFLCYLILKKAEKLASLPAVLGAYSLVVWPHFVFNSNPIGEMHSFFWPLFLYVFLFGERLRLQRTNVKIWLSFILLLAPLCLSHELAGLLLILVLLIVLQKHYANGSIKSALPFLALMALAAASNFLRIAFGKYTTGQGLVEGTIRTLPDFKYHFAIVLCFSFFCMAFSANTKKYLRFMASFVLCISIVLFVHDLTAKQGASILSLYLWDFRLFSGGLTAAITAPILLNLKKSFASFKVPLAVAATSCTLAIGIADLKITKVWKSGMDDYLKYSLYLGPGCHLIPFEEYRNRFIQFGMPSPYAPMYSLTLQARNRVTTMLFSINPEDIYGIVGTDACELVKKGNFYFFGINSLFPSPYLVDAITTQRSGSHSVDSTDDFK